MPLLRLLVLALALALPASLRAGEPWTPFTQAGFDEAQAAGRTIVVDVHADWCPTCRKQAPILAELLTNEAALGDVVALKVEFDREKDFLRAHNVPGQSTLLVFKGREEVARSTGETDPGRLRAFLVDAVS